MKDQIFILKINNEIEELNEVNFVSEDKFQSLLADFPKLISGSQLDPDNPRKWILISREMGVRSDENSGYTWSLDHLFIDQDGIPTLVEVKRSTDTRIRREVVGQMLDYAANSVNYWSIEEIRTKFELNCQNRGVEPENILGDILEENSNQDEFWDSVNTNLQAGKIRLLFVADKIPRELQRIIEFLNEQMSPAEVLGLEIKQYANENLKTLVPRVIGKTIQAQDKKSQLTHRNWDRESFMAQLEKNCGSKHFQLADKLLSTFEDKVSRFWYGSGKTMGSIFLVLDRKLSNSLFALWTNGGIELQFQHYNRPFDKLEKRKHLMDKLNAIEGINLPEDRISKRPSFDIAILEDQVKFDKFVKIFDWFIDEVNKME